MRVLRHVWKRRGHTLKKTTAVSSITKQAFSWISHWGRPKNTMKTRSGAKVKLSRLEGKVQDQVEWHHVAYRGHIIYTGWEMLNLRFYKQNSTFASCKKMTRSLTRHQKWTWAQNQVNIQDLSNSQKTVRFVCVYDVSCTLTATKSWGYVQYSTVSLHNKRNNLHVSCTKPYVQL